MCLMVDGCVSSLWPILHYDDTETARRFLVEGLGLREARIVRDDDGDIVHGELRWPGGGALVFGGTKHTGGVHEGLKAGALYLITDNVDAVYHRVREASGEVVTAPQPTQFGAGTAAAYAFTASDPEGNLWTVGNYPGAR